MPELTEDQRKIIQKITASQVRYDRRKNSRDYYNGVHLTQLTERQRKYLQIKTGQEFNDNYCPIVVDSLSERLSVTGFVAVDDELQTAAITDWWSVNRLDAGQSDVHNAAIRDGDTYVLVEWDNVNARPFITFEPAFDGAEGAEIIYDPDKRRRPAYGYKRWKSEAGLRMNVYYPDRVEKYSQGENSGDWSLNTVEVWVGEIPLFHFRNRSDGYNYGKSELHDVMPLQNALNKSIIDMIAAADTTGFRMYWMTGGDPSGLVVAPGEFIYTEDADAKIGYMQGEDLSKLIEFKDSFAMEIARVSRTPLSFFQITRQVASEGTLKQQESGLVSRAKKRQIEFGNTWEDVFKFAVKLHNLFGSEPLYDEAATISCQWEDPETRDDLGRLQELKAKKDLGVPEDVIWSEMGYDKATIDTFKQSPDYLASQDMRKLNHIRVSQEDQIPPIGQ
jgi:hypothetical protein